MYRTHSAEFVIVNEVAAFVDEPGCLFNQKSLAPDLEKEWRLYA